jgi:hypothetical protein
MFMYLRHPQTESLDNRYDYASDFFKIIIFDPCIYSLASVDSHYAFPIPVVQQVSC